MTLYPLVLLLMILVVLQSQVGISLRRHVGRLREPSAEPRTPGTNHDTSAYFRKVMLLVLNLG